MVLAVSDRTGGDPAVSLRWSLCRDLAVRSDDVTIRVCSLLPTSFVYRRPLSSVVVILIMTITTDSFEVIEVQSDLRMFDRNRIYLNDVVNYLGRLIDTFA